MKQKEVKETAWLLTGMYWVIGIACLLWGGIIHINNNYGHVLMLALILPVIVATLLTFGLCLHWIANGLVGVVYSLTVLGIGLQYKMQSTKGLLYLLLVIIVYVIIVAIVAPVKTLKNRKDGLYYYVDENDKKKESTHFLVAYKNNFLDSATGGVIELIFAIIFD